MTVHSRAPASLPAGPAGGTELSSIRAASRATILIVGGAIVLLAVLNEWGTVSGRSRLLIGVAVLLAFAALIPRAWSAWLAVAGIVATALAALPLPAESPLRVNESTTIFVAAYFGVALCSRRWGPAWIVAMLALWFAIPGTVAFPFDVLGHDVSIRWITGLQLAVSAAWLWRIWEPELTGASDRDSTVLATEDARISAIAIRERVRVWREAAVRTHETVLNDIRYVLSTSAIDTAALAEQLDSLSLGSSPPDSNIATARSLVDAVARGEGRQARLTYSGPLIAIDPAAVPAVRSALVEFTRNALRHGMATHVSVTAHVKDDRPVLALRHDGTEPASTPAAGSIGTRIVLAESLRAFAIDVTAQPDGVDLVLPERVRNVAWSGNEVPDIGRTALSSVTAANAVGGCLFGAALLVSGGTASALAGVATFAVTALAARTALRRARVSPAAVAVAAVLAFAVPVFALPAVRACGTAELAVIVSVLAGLALSAVIAWAPGVAWWSLAAPWAFGMVLLGVNLPAQCRQPADASLLTATVPALFAVVIYLSLGSATRRARAVEQLRVREARETASADATVDLGAQLDGAVLEARSLLRGLADGDPLTGDLRRRLRCLDGQVRAALQVDPSRSGAMARAAQALVQRATEAGVPVRVLYLGGSADPRPLDPEVMAVLERVLLAATDGSAVLQLVDAPDQDTLVITVSDASAQAAGLDPAWTCSFEDGFADVDQGDTDSDTIIIVERRVRPDRRRSDPT